MPTRISFRCRMAMLWAAGALRASLACAQPGGLRLASRIELAGTSGRLDHLAYAPRRNLLFVAGLGADTVDVVDLGALRRVARITGVQEPQGLAYAVVAERLFVANGEGARVDAFDGATPAFSVAGLPDADNLRLDESARRLYVGFDRALAVIDASSGSVLQRVALPGHPEAFEVDGGRIYVNVPGAGAVLVLDAASGQVLARWQLGRARGNFAMALDAASHRLFVATRSPPLLQVFATDTGTRVQEVDLCGDADDLMWDSQGRQLFAICGDGHVAVFDAQDAAAVRLRQSVATTPGARTGLWVAALHRLFVAAPASPWRSAAVLVFSVE